MEPSNLLSGLIGTIFGVVFSGCLYWHNRYTSAKRRLADRLMFLRYDVWYTCDDRGVFKAWDDTLKEIWTFYNAFYDVAPCRKRKKVKKAWEAYKGADRKIMESLKDRVFDSKLPPKNKEEFLHKITSFIEAVQNHS